MKVKMTDADVLYDFYNVVNGEGNFYTNQRYPSTPTHHKTTHVWELNKKDLIFEFVMLFYPYMYSRRREKMIEFLTWYFKKK